MNSLFSRSAELLRLSTELPERIFHFSPLPLLGKRWMAAFKWRAQEMRMTGLFDRLRRQIASRFQSQPRRAWALTILLIALLFAAFPIRDKSDTLLSVPVSYRLLTNGNVDVTDYVDPYVPFNGIVWVDERALPYYPLGASIMALPVVALLAPFYGDLTNPAPILFGYWGSLEKFAASSICALAVVCLYWVTRSLSQSVLIAALLAGIFALASPLLSTATRALWQHGPVMVCFLATLLLFIKGRQREELVIWAALPTAFSFICRPLSGIFVLAACAYVLLCHRRKFLPFVGLGSAVAAVWFAFIYFNYGTLLTPYYRWDTFERPEWVDQSEVWWALLVSPSRGLLVYCPYLLAAIFVFMDKRLRSDPLTLLCVFMIVGHFLLIWTSPSWWGGFSIGPRLMSDVLPFFFILMIPAVRWLIEGRGAVRLCLPAIMALSVLFAGWIHWRAAMDIAQMRWNWTPASVDLASSYSHLFDWSDPQFLRGTLWDGSGPVTEPPFWEVLPPNLLSRGIATTLFHPEASEYLGAGWRSLDRSGVLNAADKAELILPMHDLPTACDRLELVLEPVAMDNGRPIAVALSIDKAPPVLWTLSGQARERKHFILPPKSSDEGVWSVQIEFVGQEPDSVRLIGIRVLCP